MTIMNRKNIKKSRTLSGWVRARFFPDCIVSSPDKIDFEALAAKGFRIVLIDIDNTLAFHGSKTCDTFAKLIIDRIEDSSLCPVIVSNARVERARTYAASLGISFIAHAKKPGIKTICRDLVQRNCPCEKALMVGDQLLTDVWSARRAGIPVILTERRSSREIFTVRIKRTIESLLILLGGRSHWNDLKGECHDRL
ncbi:MAG TPA: HAD hydrolase-like protein [Clostridiaceae bacterium]|jgi:HAD superfamily phosphatase (TIGR01668 family)|nr:HAD hydrolase-like protein [Clostridiaceae bacterium]